MPRVTFTSNLQKHLSRPTLAADGATVAEVLGALFAPDPLLRSYVLDDQGHVRKHVRVFLNNQAISDRDLLSDPVRPDDDIYIFQALSGG